MERHRVEKEEATTAEDRRHGEENDDVGDRRLLGLDDARKAEADPVAVTPTAKPAATHSRAHSGAIGVEKRAMILLVRNS